MRAYSEDLRTRVVEAYIEEEGTQKELAEHFCISRGTLFSWLKLDKTHGSLSPSTEVGINDKLSDFIRAV